MTAMLYAAGAAIVVVLGILWRLLGNAKKSGVDAQKARENEARNENIKRIKAAIDAGNKPTDSLHDPHNRDND